MTHWMACKLDSDNGDSDACVWNKCEFHYLAYNLFIKNTKS